MLDLLKNSIQTIMSSLRLFQHGRTDNSLFQRVIRTYKNLHYKQNFNTYDINRGEILFYGLLFILF